MPMTDDELMEEACRLAVESVRNDWGGPFGAVIARDGEIVARAHNRVLLTAGTPRRWSWFRTREALCTRRPRALGC